MATLDGIKLAISRRLRALRLERRIPQARLAAQVGLSQGRFSQVERGQGSFSAEQLVLLLKTFNISISDLVGETGGTEAGLQNALVRLGAGNLQADTGTLPSEKLREASAIIRESLVWAESPRQVTAIAPVLVEQVDRMNLNKLADEMKTLGLERRLGWAIENVLEAIRLESAHSLPRPLQLRYRRADVLLSRVRIVPPSPRAEGALDDDILDSDIASEKSIEQVRAERSPISKSWGMISRLKPEDFQEALTAANGH